MRFIFIGNVNEAFEFTLNELVGFFFLLFRQKFIILLLMEGLLEVFSKVNSYNL